MKKKKKRKKEKERERKRKFEKAFNYLVNGERAYIIIIHIEDLIRHIKVSRRYINQQVIK
jgi:hypothetical protein